MEQDRANAVRATGTLDVVRAGRRETSTVVTVRNAVRGAELSCALQVRGPFGAPFQLPLRLDGLVEGRELLESDPGTALVAEGALEWRQHEDARYAPAPGERGRRVTEVVFRPRRLMVATPEDEPGCDVWLEGVVRRDARRYVHPERRVPIAVVSLEVQVERARRGSLARMVEPVEVQVAIPLGHADLPKLMRRGNRVGVEGMLERVVVPLRGDDEQVRRAVAALDQQWSERPAGAGPAEERRYTQRRHGLQQTVLTRVVAGYVALLEGAPASLEEAQRMREERRREREVDQAERAARQAEHGQTEIISSGEPDDDSVASEEPPSGRARPRRLPSIDS